MSSVPAVVPYDESWPSWFGRVRAALAPLLAPWATTPIEHIGSTAVPGMQAKPLLDLMVGVADLTSAGAAADALVATDAGWERRPHRVDAVLAVLVDNDTGRVSLQLTTTAGDLWRERITFRDARLRAPGAGRRRRRPAR